MVELLCMNIRVTAAILTLSEKFGKLQQTFLPQLQDNQQSQQQGSTVDTVSSNGTISSPMTSTAGSLSYSQANMQCLTNDEFAQQAQQAFYSQGDMLSMLQQQNSTNNSKIPDIVLSGKSVAKLRWEFCQGPVVQKLISSSTFL